MQSLKQQVESELEWTKLKNSFGNETGEVGFNPHFLDQPIANNYMEKLRNNIEWKFTPVKIFGKSVMQPRKVSFANKDGKGYKYSGQTLESQVWTKELEELAQLVKEATPGAVEYDSAHMNLYENGDYYISPHSDNEPLWGKDPTIASLSLGATRDFILIEKKSKEGANPEMYRYSLPSGSLLIMRGPTQSFWKHTVPRDCNIKEPRINITFRKMVQPPDKKKRSNKDKNEKKETKKTPKKKQKKGEEDSTG